MYVRTHARPRRSDDRRNRSTGRQPDFENRTPETAGERHKFGQVESESYRKPIWRYIYFLERTKTRTNVDVDSPKTDSSMRYVNRTARVNESVSVTTTHPPTTPRAALGVEVSRCLPRGIHRRRPRDTLRGSRETTAVTATGIPGRSSGPMRMVPVRSDAVDRRRRRRIRPRRPRTRPPGQSRGSSHPPARRWSASSRRGRWEARGTSRHLRRGVAAGC